MHVSFGNTLAFSFVLWQAWNWSATDKRPNGEQFVLPLPGDCISPPNAMALTETFT